MFSIIRGQSEKNKERKDKLADVDDLWTTLFFVGTSTPFPCEYRRLQITIRDSKTLSPIETAVRGVIEKKTKNLKNYSKKI